MPIDNAVIAVAGIAVLAVVAVLLVLHHRRQQRLELRLLAGRERLLSEEMAACQAALTETDGSRRNTARATAEAALDALHTRLAERQAHLLNYEDLIRLQECRLEAMVAARQAADGSVDTWDDEQAHAALAEPEPPRTRKAPAAAARADRPATDDTPKGRRGYPPARPGLPTERPPEGGAASRPPVGSRFGGSVSTDLDAARRRPVPDRDDEGASRRSPAERPPRVPEPRQPQGPTPGGEADADGPPAAARGLPWLADRIRARTPDTGESGTDPASPPHRLPPAGPGTPPAKSRAQLEEELREKMRRLRGDDGPPPGGQPPRRG